MKEDEDKFKFVDEDGDGKLDLEEYLVFYYFGVKRNVFFFEQLDKNKFLKGDVFIGVG